MSRLLEGFRLRGPAGDASAKGLAASVVVALVATVWLSAVPGAFAADGRRPDIVLIMSDDMGFSDLGCYGGEIRTPNLDRLAAAGVRFTQFYNTGRCCPTRASLLTGLYPHQAGVGHMLGDTGLAGYSGGLNQNCRTIAEVLKPAGYATYMTGKWHVTRDVEPEGPKHNWPCQRGFDRFYGTIVGGGSFFDPRALCRQNEHITPQNDPEYRPETFYYTHAISDNAVRFVRDHHADQASKPFFLYMAYTAAHWPMHALPEDIAKYAGAYDTGYAPARKARYERVKQLGLVDPEWQLTPQAGDWDGCPNKAWEARCMEVYAAMVESMDQGIGRVVDTLRELGRLDNTLILFLQDNGGCAEEMGRRDVAAWHLQDLRPMEPDALQPKGSPPMQTRDGRPVLGGPNVMPGPADTFIGYGRDWANVSNTPFREYKHWVHEGGISTPLIAHWPAGTASQRRGQLEHQPGHLVDLMATCVDVAGATYPREVEGRPITPLEGISLHGAFAEPLPERPTPLYWEHEGNRALREGRWKLVAKGPLGAWELYDMQADRTEMHDLASAQPERAQQMAEAWEAWAQRAHAKPWPWDAKTAEFSRNRRFELKSADRLPRQQAPHVVDRSLEIQARIARFADGVIVAQGGSAWGYALYVSDGQLCLATRHRDQLTRISADTPLPDREATVGVRMGRDGSVSVTLDGDPIAEGRTPGPLQMPVDGLEVGCDERGAVGPYEAPNRFGGEIVSVRIELSD